MKYDCIVIGAGIAGMTAAIYLKRANINVLLLESNVPGGQINRSASIENYPGFINIDGPALAMNVFSQVTHLGIPYQYGEVIRIDEKNDYKMVVTTKEEIECNGVIIATGRKQKELGLGETNLVGHGVSWCAICDGPFFKEKEVCVVGGGNSALEEAIYLSDICKQVILIHRRDEFRGEKTLVDRVKQKENIKILYNSVIDTLIETKGKLSSIIVKDEKNFNEITCEGLFISIGLIPATNFLKNSDIELHEGYIQVDQNMRTNHKGIYACGDVIQKDIYQLTTAVSEGAIAAMSFQKDQ